MEGELKMASIEQLEKRATKKWAKRVSKAKKSIGKTTKRKTRKGKWGAPEDTLLWNVGTGSGAPKLW